MLNELMADTLKRFGYGIDPPRPPSGGAAMGASVR
jgi:hypothetical protein